ncbi:Zn(II)2Cys6 transcription factor domain-containing protein [Aspergillus affinis]|uniref:Zn(II)2Cys6 transcription factor domain-containing protein n=1 Tax=Aspergillus affinis TaxID=1070780 RepID=UPI0022FF2B64|nr:sterol uptake control protein 2 [Aspergillus affinis]KAI9045306.1 sterol uptake control protein 2 [Aspergillus affinis]
MCLQCDERQPKCTNCLNRNTECVYASREVDWVPPSQSERSSSRHKSPAASSTPSSSGWMGGSDPLPQASDPNISDMELLLQWCSSTYATMAHDQRFEHLYQYVLPKEGLEYPFVLHGLLALSALHIARASDPASNTRYFSIALEHQNRALALFRPVISSINRDNSHTIFAFASLLLQLAFAMSPCSPLIETHDSVEDLIQVFKLCRGLREIVAASWHWVKEGKLADVFTQVDDSKQWPLPETTEAAMSQLKYFNESRGRQFVDHDADCYNAAIDHLKDMMEIYQGKPHRVELAMRWPFGLESKYLNLLRERDPMALAILAHYCLVLHHFRHHWWLEGWSIRVAQSIWDQLHESWKPYVSWVIKEVGLDV